MGFVGAMAAAYCQLGYDTLGGTDGMLEGLAAMLAATAGKPHPTTAMVVSQESDDYRAELTWLAAGDERARTSAKPTSAAPKRSSSPKRRSSCA